jgi:hypothetical protein
MRTERYELVSPRPLDVIVERARSAGASGFRSGLSAWGALVRGRTNSRRIVMVRRSIVNNSWRPYLFAALEATATGTHLQVEIRPTQYTRAITWLIAPMGLVFCIGSLASGSAIGFVGLLFPLWELLVTALAGWMARNDRAMLRSVISDVAGV